MGVRLESMCQADGKVYLQVLIDPLHDGAMLTMEARLRDGTLIPSHLFPFSTPVSSNANFVVVLPHLDVREVELSFAQFVEGYEEPLTSSFLTVEINMLRWKTRFNALVRNDLVVEMLDVEHDFGADRMNVYFTEAIDDGVEFIVKMLVDMPYFEGIEPMVHFYDLNGRDMDVTVYALTEEVLPPRRFGDGQRMRTGFSVRIPRSLGEFCAAAYEASDMLPGGFAVFTQETAEPLLRQFHKGTTDAAHDSLYDVWYREHSATYAELAMQVDIDFEYRPVISLVMVLFDNDLSRAKRAFDALMSQTYPHFELIVVDGTTLSSDANRDKVLVMLDSDPRVQRYEISPGISRSNAVIAGLKEVRGDYTAVIDVRFELAPEALFEAVRRMNEVKKAGTKATSLATPVSEIDLGVQLTATFRAVSNAGPVPCDVIYSNHDHVGAGGSYISPVFKPAYSPDYLYSGNYLGPFLLVSTAIVEQIVLYEGLSSEALFYDLTLKAVSRAKLIERIDQVLYHVHAKDDTEFMALYDGGREEVFRFGRKVLANHLRNQEMDVRVLGDEPKGIYQVEYLLPENPPTLSIVIPSKDRVDILEPCIESIFAGETLETFEIIIVDNGSVEEETFQYYQRLTTEHHNVRVIAYQQAFSISAMVNLAAENSKAEYLLLLHNDTELITPGGISQLLGHCMRKDVGVVGAKLLYADDTIQHAGMTINEEGEMLTLGVNMPRTAPGYGSRFICASNVSGVSSACQMIKRSVFDEVGGYRQSFTAGYFDIDFCQRVIEGGYVIALDAGVELYHREHATLGHSITRKRRERLERESGYFHYLWPHRFIDGDPYLSEGLDPYSGYFRLRPL